MRANKKSENGYILPEALIAATILMIALVPIMSMYIMAQKNTGHSLNRTTAVFLAQGKIEELKNARHSNGTFGAASASDAKKLNGVTFSRMVTVENYALSSVNLILVNVDVEWQSGGQNHNVSLAAYFEK
jgi:Tfp pilus assembly protein PilV